MQTSLSRYLADPAAVYQHFKFYRGTVHPENKLDAHTTLYKACALSDIQSRFLVKVQRFHKDQLRRFLALAQAVEARLVLASKIFLERDADPDLLIAHVVEPSPETSTCETLSAILKAGNLTYAQRQTIFRNLVDAVLELERLGEPHLELSPSTILLETKSLVYVRPFSVGFKSQSDYYWYSAPEELLQEQASPACDVWALGCIYAEMFVSLTPLFQGVSVTQKLTKMFEVLGVPEFGEVQEYMTEETYEEVCANISPESAQGDLLSALSEQERRLLLSMLQFSPRLRKSLEDLQALCTPYLRPYVPPFADQVAAGPYEFNEQSSTSQHKRSSLDQLDYLTPEEDTFGRQSASSLLSDPSPRAAAMPLQRTEKSPSLHIRARDTVTAAAPDSVDIDNTLTITIVCLKNLHHFKYAHELEGTIDYHLSFAYELDSRGAGRVVTPGYRAAERVTVGHVQEFHINSEQFRRAHRHQPIVISVLLGSEQGEDLLGVCEVYLGLLFSSLGDSSCVRGWYHIMPESSSAPMGQMEVEVRTRLPIAPRRDLVASSPERTLVAQSRGELAGLCAGLDQLTSSLLHKDPPKPQEDAFETTLQQLRKLVFQDS